MPQKMSEIAKQIVFHGKGILAADESLPTIKKRFDKIGLESTENTRHEYRKMLFTTPKIEEYISGVILFDETIRQDIDGVSVPQYLLSRGILPGIKVDKGTVLMALHAQEKVTEGLDGLRQRFAEYVSLGAHFAKWRAVYVISADTPSAGNIHANAHDLARYAALAQEAGLVPMVEPEVLMDGNHALDRCYEITKKVLMAVFNELKEQRVVFEGLILKTNMVLAGQDAPEKPLPAEVAKKTISCLLDVVPKEVPGIAFLSGGQSEQEATDHLRAINTLAISEVDVPWALSFSYGRALQHSALLTWNGQERNAPAAQKVFLERAKANGLATKGM